MSSKTYVALDLETTGLDPNRDAIIEIGALRFRGDREFETFSTFVNPGRNIPHLVTELTGITNAHVRGAPPLRQSLRRLLDFVGDAPIVGHNVSFDLAFLRRHNVLMRNPGIDTFELASILVPHAGRYSLANLVQEMNLNLPEQTHRALDDARMAFALYVALMDRATQLPQDTLKEIVRLGKYINWPAVGFFRDAQYSRRRQGFSGGIGAQLAARRGGDAAGPLFMVEEEEFDLLEPNAEEKPLNIEALVALLDPDGLMKKAFPGYEARPQQVEMLQSVAQAFNSGRHLLVEAGTGTGKSLAYLIPALYWAVQNQQRVVVSTNTINLQEQLANKDVPQLAEVLPLKFRSMILKGRSHYLCRQQFEVLRHRGPADEHEMRVLSKVMLWLPNTLDGDGDELFLPTKEERAIWSRISARRENCNPDRCRYYAGDRCFFYQARAKAQTAHLLIVNHALLLADVASRNHVLPEYDLLVIDEGHHLEAATTNALHFAVSWPMIRSALKDLLSGSSMPTGMLDSVRSASSRLPRKIAQALVDVVLHVEDAAEAVQHRVESVFDTLELFLQEHSRGNSRYAVRLRITDSLRKQPSWDSIEMTWDRCRSDFAKFVESLGKLVRGIEDLSNSDAPALDELYMALLTIHLHLVEAQHALQNSISEPDDNTIYWLESWNNMPVTLNAVPLHVGPLVQEHLFEKKRSVVLTSATLRIGGDFDYLRGRLNAWDADSLSVGSPFDYASSALLYLLNDIPEPGRPGYQDAVEKALINLFTATQGRGMALFTSYSQLRATAQGITSALASQDITVYAQGGGNSRAQLLQNFRKKGQNVLLGTRSFWEGVDIPGEALSCLVIVKLPFDVPSDPIVSARSETYDDSFNEYMVPEAVLRFMQGFGRLIRTQDDRGLVVVLDRRLLTKRYGQSFINSLPNPAVRIDSKLALAEVSRNWLAGDPLPEIPVPEPKSDSGSGSWSVPPPEEPPWDLW